jgi:hypothetical protein
MYNPKVAIDDAVDAVDEEASISTCLNGRIDTSGNQACCDDVCASGSLSMELTYENRGPAS